MITIASSKRIWKEGWNLLPKDLLVAMLNNQIKLGINGGIGISGKLESGMANWCDENCNGLYRLHAGCGYFEQEEDMVAFKIYWEGKDDSEWV